MPDASASCVFLDRDNTLIDNDGDLGDPDAVRLLPGTAAALSRLRDAGFRLVVVSNQGGVARGAFSERDVEAVNRRIAELVAAEAGRPLLERFYFCPCHPRGTVARYRREHPWRKPAPGMLLAAADELGLDLKRCWLVGDQLRDVEAGRAAGCATVLLSADPETASAAGATAVAADLGRAADRILAAAGPREADPPAGPAPVPPGARRVLVVCPSWVGDVVMATPVLRALRRARPEAHVIAACRPGLDHLLAGLPWIDECVVEETKRLRGSLALVRRLRRALPLDAALLLPNSLRSALLARFGGARRRVGYRRYGRGALLTGGLDPPRQRPVPAPQYYARLGAFALGLRDVDRRLELAVTGAERAAAQRLLEGVGRPFVLLCPGASKPPKRWPAARFAQVADALAEDGLGATATGAPAEAPVVRAVVEAAARPVIDLVDRGVDLGALKAVVAEAALVVTNDTGPRLIAAALGTPVVSLFGPTDFRWTAFDCPLERRIVAEPFLPEPLVADDHPRQCGIERIAVGDVLFAARALLDAGRGASQ